MVGLATLSRPSMKDRHRPEAGRVTKLTWRRQCAVRASVGEDRNRNTRMEGLPRSDWLHRLDFNALAGQRDMAARLLAGIGAAVLLIYAAQHAYMGRSGAAWVNLMASLVLGLNALSLHFRRRPAYPYLALSLMLLGVICTSVYLQGVPGLFWAYPAVIISFFTLVVWRAIIVGCLTLVGVTIAALLGPAAALAVRFSISLAFVLVMITVVILVVADLQRSLLAQTLTDPLTGAFNRRSLDAEMASSRSPAANSPSADALLAIDVDHFKRINDQHGHDAGDLVLRELTKTLMARKRAGDLVFRLGGEEFVVLVRRVTRQTALMTAESLRQNIAEAELLPGHPVTVSVGISVREPGQEPDSWLKRADLALYQAKRDGRNRVVEASTLPLT